MAEGNSGLTAFPFTITRSGPATGTTTVDWSVMQGSGQAPATDFQNGQLPHGTVTFAPGVSHISSTLRCASRSNRRLEAIWFR
jgi:hypothetical protein